MNEVVTDLRELNEDVPCPLELPDEEDLLNIEEDLLISIPKDMKDFLLSVSDVIYGSLEPVTAADPHSHTYLSDVAATAWEMGVPRAYIPICEHQGTYYCVTMESSVVLWADGQDTEEIWDSVWRWTEDVWMQKTPE